MAIFNFKIIVMILIIFIISIATGILFWILLLFALYWVIRLGADVFWLGKDKEWW